MSETMKDPILRVGAKTEEGKAKLSPYRVFPGIDNIPFRIPKNIQVPQLKQDDPAHMQPATVADAHAKVFNLGKQADLAEYNDVWDKAAKGIVLISKEESHWSDREQTFLVFLRWGELYLEIPKEGLDAHRTFSS